MDENNDEDNEMLVRGEKMEVIVIGGVATAAAAVAFGWAVTTELTANTVVWYMVEWRCEKGGDERCDVVRRVDERMGGDGALVRDRDARMGDAQETD